MYRRPPTNPLPFLLFLKRFVPPFPSFATRPSEVIYIAGDRVVTDAMCKPFSMGRNLLCVHSKKHMDDYPELKAAKMAMNRKTLVTMQRLLNEGGRLIWVAPSGGRDRASTPVRPWKYRVALTAPLQLHSACTMLYRESYAVTNSFSPPAPLSLSPASRIPPSPRPDRTASSSRTPSTPRPSACSSR